jgi:2,4'-dihydroxyacetophenone dioxygenase
LTTEVPSRRSAVIDVSIWSPKEIVERAVSVDEREWVPTTVEGVAVRPLLFDTIQGAWVNVTRLRRSGLITRHAHPCPVHGYVISGSWKYEERDWVAAEGSYVFEPPGDIHTLIGDGAESLTMFWITGTLIEMDETGNVLGYADVFTRIEQASRHYESVGLGADYVKKFIR